MKTTFRILTVAAFLAVLLPFVSLAGGKPFEGVITYKITYPDSKFDENTLAMMPKMMVTSVKGSKSRTDMSSGMGSQASITDYAARTKVGLLAIMGQKFAIRETMADIQKEIDGQPKATVQITGETKQILGYNCKKAIVTTQSGSDKTTMDVWFTSELGSKELNFDNPVYKDIDGMLMEFSVKERQLTMVLTVTGIEKKSVSDKEFEIPSDYKETTKEQLKSMFGGMGGE